MMTKDDIIRMVGIAGYRTDVTVFDHDLELLEYFAALVAAFEREACAKLVEPDFEHKGFPSDYLCGEEGVELLDCIAAKIRARIRP